METLVAIIGAVATLVSAFSIGTLIKFFVERKDAKNEVRMLAEENATSLKRIDEEMKLVKAMSLGALYDRARHLGEKYIEKGFVTMQEYSDWHKYLYQPYHEAGGDGTIDKIKKELDKLPIEG